MKEGNLLESCKNVKKGLSCRKASMRHLPILRSFINNNDKRGRSRIKSGMTALFNNRAFTLIELLVVVLIIGILAAVAIPQYNKVVEKSKATQALTLLKAVAQAEEVYYMENGYYTNTFAELDLQIPWSGNERFATNWINGISNDEWSLQTNLSRYTNDVSGDIMGIIRLTGPYQGAGFAYVMERQSNSGVSIPPGLYCAERYGKGVTFQKNDGEYCKLFNSVYAGSVIHLRLYRMQ